jgi:hypothetical protein
LPARSLYQHKPEYGAKRTNGNGITHDVSQINWLDRTGAIDTGKSHIRLDV